MGYSIRNGELGFECDVCGVILRDIRLLKDAIAVTKIFALLIQDPFLSPLIFLLNFLGIAEMMELVMLAPTVMRSDKEKILEKEEEEKQRQKGQESPWPSSSNKKQWQVVEGDERRLAVEY